MEYVEKQTLFQVRYELKSDGLAVEVSGWFRPNASHFIPRAMCSSAVAHTEVRDKLIVTLIQVVFMAAFIAVVVGHVTIEKSGPTLWLGLAVTLSGMAFGTLLAPKRRVFTIYSSSGVPMLNVFENRGADGNREFDQFVSGYLSWVTDGK